MKRFVFRLASVLRVREFELERARHALAAIEFERVRRERVVAESADRHSRGQELLRSESEEGADGERLALRADGVTIGRRGLEQAREARLELEPALLEARRRVRRARALVRSLEKLRERRAGLHRRENAAAEQRELEELARARTVHGSAWKSRPCGGSSG